MALDKEIRFVGVINERGKLLAGGLREGLKSLEDPKDYEMLIMVLALRVRMRKQFDTHLCSVKIAMSLREKVIVMSFPMSDYNILYVSSDIGLDYGKITPKILKIIQ